jgi:hypothetical protein
LNAAVDNNIYTHVSDCIVLGAFENGVSRNKLDLKGNNILKTRENYTVRSFLTHTLNQVLLNIRKKERWAGRGIW